MFPYLDRSASRQVLLAGLLSIFCMSVAAQGLRVDDDGRILKEGAPVYAIGVNYMDAFTRCLENPEDRSYREGFALLAAHDIPFARLNFGGFYPVGWKGYQTDKAGYFSRLDDVVRAAEEAGVGLVPSLFWWSACIPDIVGEPRNRWGDPKSKTHAFMKTYVTEVVTRYKDSPAIWAWEFGNEYNLAVDLPNAADHRPWTHVHKGSPATRGPDDDLQSEMVRVALIAFGDAVRAVDPKRPISAGHSLSRPSAHHLRMEGAWTPDSGAELRDNLVYMTPDPLDLISIHVYPHAREQRFGEGVVTYERLFQEARQAADGAGKGLFVGEFGPPPDNAAPWTRESAREEGERMMEALLASPVQLAAFWVFDFAWQEASMSVTATNHRRGYLKALQTANRGLAAKP